VLDDHIPAGFARSLFHPIHVATVEHDLAEADQAAGDHVGADR
jgi:hypothetical protein